MRRLPRAIDFNDKDFPELADIFRAIDIGIAAIVGSDPTLRPDPQPRRTMQPAHSGTTRPSGGHGQRQAA